MLAVMLVLACDAAQATPITYDLSFGSGAPDKLTGSITTDGTIGAINEANITAWSFMSVGAVAFQLSSADVGTFSLCGFGVSACFTATAGALLFDFSATSLVFTEFGNGSPHAFVSFLNSNGSEVGGPSVQVGQRTPISSPRLFYAPPPGLSLAQQRAPHPYPSHRPWCYWIAPWLQVSEVLGNESDSGSPLRSSIPSPARHQRFQRVTYSSRRAAPSGAVLCCS
jgi:hypothetical protein